MIGVTTAIVQDTRVKRTDGTYAIKLRITYNREQKYYPVNIHLSPEDWQRTQSEKPRNEFKEHKLYFNKIEQRAIEIIKELSPFSFEGFEKKFDQRTDRTKDVLTYLDAYIKQLEKEERSGTADSFEFHPLFNLRGGVVLNPIGAFNQNHDGPKWEYIDRPVSATQMLPATWSNVGFGIYGKKHKNNWAYAYELYLTNGFDDQIISNTENKTFLPASKLNRNRFEESFNGEPLITAKVAIRNKKIGELGLSYMGGVYNKFQIDGLVLDEKRRVDTWAIDFNTTLSPTKTYLVTEWAFINVDVPDTYTQQYGNKQAGGFLDIVQPIFKGTIFDFQNSVINAACRMEYVDWNIGAFKETGGNIREDFVSVVPGLSWRPTSQTVLRLNYRYNWTTDLLGNPSSRTAGFQFGFSSYF